MNTRIIIVPEYITEEELGGWLNAKDSKIKVIKICKRTSYEIRHAIMELEDYPERWAFYQEAISRIFTMQSKGKPDFFICNNKMFILAEFKGKGDSLSQDQIIWFEKNIDLPTALILAHDSMVSLKDKPNPLSSNVLNEEEEEELEI